MTTKTSIWQVDINWPRKSTNRCSLSAKMTLFSKAELSLRFVFSPWRVFPLFGFAGGDVDIFVYFSTFSPSLTSLHCCYCWTLSPTQAVAHLKPSVYFNTHEAFRFHPLDQTHVPGRGECWRSPCHVSPESAAIRGVLFNISADKHKYCIFIHKKQKGYFTALNRNSRGREVLVRFLYVWPRLFLNVRHYQHFF